MANHETPDKLTAAVAEVAAAIAAAGAASAQAYPPWEPGYPGEVLVMLDPARADLTLNGKPVVVLRSAACYWTVENGGLRGPAPRSMILSATLEGADALAAGAGHVAVCNHGTVTSRTGRSYHHRTAFLLPPGVIARLKGLGFPD